MPQVPADRRTILKTAFIAAPAILLMPARGLGTAGSPTPFTLGVASGDPWADSVVLWTRLAPDPLQPDGGMPRKAVPVRWEVAEDVAFSRVVRSGEVLAHPAAGHAVHVEAAGLRPAHWYFYRFIAAGQSSPVGRTRTAPAPGAAVDRLRFCFGSCQKYEAGHYAAWRHVASDDPDLIVFLGDYIYEGDPTPGALRRHANPEPRDLSGYRVRYATYRLDPLLQGAHAAAPWITTWDDHEVDNDYADMRDEDNGDPAAFLRRRAHAYQVYWEHMPLRAAAHPRAASMQLYRTLDWGRLAQFQILDTRQYRGPRPCQPPEFLRPGKRWLSSVPDCPDLHDPTRSFLGDTQERWLLDRLGTSRASWNLLTQQTLMTPFGVIDPARPERGAILNPADRWQGYRAARDRIFRRWAEAKTPNPMVLSGDIHAFTAAEIVHPDRPDGAALAPEFVGGSITSTSNRPAWRQEIKLNPDIRFADYDVRGYARVDLREAEADIAFRGLADARDPLSTVSTIARFTVASGRPGIAETAVAPRS